MKDDIELSFIAATYYQMAMIDDKNNEKKIFITGNDEKRIFIIRIRYTSRKK